MWAFFTAQHLSHIKVHCSKGNPISHLRGVHDKEGRHQFKQDTTTREEIRSLYISRQDIPSMATRSEYKFGEINCVRPTILAHEPRI